MGCLRPNFEIEDLKWAVTGVYLDDSVRLDFYRISTKNQTLDWAYIAVITRSDLKFHNAFFATKWQYLSKEQGDNVIPLF